MVYIMFGDCGALPTHAQVKGLANLPLNEADPTRYTPVERVMSPYQDLSIQEDRYPIAQGDKAQTIKKAPAGFSTPSYSDIPGRAPPTCSGCKIWSHTIVRCFTRRIIQKVMNYPCLGCWE